MGKRSEICQTLRKKGKWIFSYSCKVGLWSTPKKVIFSFRLWRFPFLAPNSEFCSASSFEAAAEEEEEEHKEERKDGRERRRINRRKKRLTSSSLISSGFAKGKERKQKCEIRKRQQEFEGKDGFWQEKKSFLQKMKDSKARSRNCTFQKRLNSKNALNPFLSRAFFLSFFFKIFQPRLGRRDCPFRKFPLFRPAKSRRRRRRGY